MAASPSRETYLHVVESAAQLIAQAGASGASTRAICAAAGIQPPVLYRLFGDKQGLLDAVALHTLDVYLSQPITTPDDPVEALRASWELHVRFGLTHPHVYGLIYGIPRQGNPSPAMLRLMDALKSPLHRVAQASRLRVSQSQALSVIHATCNGVTLALLYHSPEHRDMTTSDLAREACIRALTTEAPATEAVGPNQSAIAMRAWAPQLNALTLPERLLLQEWLDRVISDASE